MPNYEYWIHYFATVGPMLLFAFGYWSYRWTVITYLVLTVSIGTLNLRKA